MDDSEPIRYFLDVKNLGPKGFEVVVSVVNEGEDWLYVKGAQVEIDKDGKSFGRHPVAFLKKPGANGAIRLGQFEIAEGHFHISQDLVHDSINFQVFIDYKFGDDSKQTQQFKRRVETKRITKSKASPSAG
jgi:hypothetical protein